jgi:hypothetical protein
VLGADEIGAALRLGYEGQRLELKGPGPRSDPHLFAKVARAALGMGNLRDGGHVIIGIDDRDPKEMLPGLEAGDLASWLAYDDVARKLAAYAEPPLRFDVARIELPSGANVAVIQVFEFSDIPYLCARDYPEVLRKGALYVRSRKVPETSEIASVVEMRDLIELATEKALRAYVATAERAGLTLAGSTEEPQPPSGDEGYEAERERGWGVSETTDKIRSKGHWDVAIRPEPFRENRLDYEDLDEILAGAVVRLRGWPVPYIDHREQLLRGDNWIGQDVDAEIVAHYEAWRFFASGQFTHLRAISADWRTGPEGTPVPDGFDAVIEVWEILFYVTEVFEVAARLVLGPAGDDRMTVDVRLNGLQSRGLVVGQPGRLPFMEPYRTTSESIRQTVTLSRDELVADTRVQAVKIAREFFLRFGWKPPIDQLAEHQRELTERS